MLSSFSGVLLPALSWSSRFINSSKLALCDRDHINLYVSLLFGVKTKAARGENIVSVNVWRSNLPPMKLVHWSLIFHCHSPKYEYISVFHVGIKTFQPHNCRLGFINGVWAPPPLPPYSR